MSADAKLETHLSHCNFGEYAGLCKYNHPEYGDPPCPALSEQWSWFGNALQRAEIKDVEYKTDYLASTYQINEAHRYKYGPYIGVVIGLIAVAKAIQELTAEIYKRNVREY